MLLSDLKDEFLIDCKIRNLSELTIKNYDKQLEHFIIFLEKKYNLRSIEEVTSAHIKAFLKYYLDRQCKANYVNDNLKAIKVFCKYAYQERYTSALISENVKNVKVPKELIHTFSKEEIVRMIRYFKGTSYLDLRDRVGRVRTTNTSVLNNINEINYAMSSSNFDGEPKEPNKISFKTQTYKINDVKKQVDKSTEKRTVVSPFGLFINNGKYYMLGYNDSNHNIYTYRVDRMKDVRQLEGEPREGHEAIKKKGGVKKYAERRFSLQTSGTAKVELEFSNYCLDMVIDRLGTEGVKYYLGSDRDKQFAVTIADVELTNEFFAWIMSFGKSVKILTPEVAQKYLSLLDGIKSVYNASE